MTSKDKNINMYCISKIMLKKSLNRKQTRKTYREKSPLYYELNLFNQIILYSVYFTFFISTIYAQPSRSQESTHTQKPSQNQLKLIPSLDLQGHRGARGLMPENTLPAFKEALKRGMNTLELDVSLTQDHQLLVYHDTRLNLDLCVAPPLPPHTPPTTLIQFPSSWLTQLDCGRLPNPRFPEQKRIPKTPPPLLKQVFELEKTLQKRPLYNLEIKVDSSHQIEDKINALKALAVLLASLQKSYPTLYTRITLQSFDLEVLEITPQYLPNLRRSALFAPTSLQWGCLQLPSFLHAFCGNWGRKIIHKAQALGVDVISPYMDYVTPYFIPVAHAAKLKVIPWTVNNIDRMKRLIQMGVDGLISDYPNRLNQAVQELGASVECRTYSSDHMCTHLISSQLKDERTRVRSHVQKH